MTTWLDVMKAWPGWEPSQVTDEVLDEMAAAMNGGTVTVYGDNLHIDASPAINTAIDELQARGGGTLWFPAGTYRLTETLVLPSSISMAGDGRSTSSTTAATLIESVISGSDAIRIEGAASSARNFYLRNVTSTAVAIRIRATRCLIRDVTISHFTSHGIMVDSFDTTNCNGFGIEDCRVTNCGGDGIHLIGADSNTGLISRCDLSINAGWGISTDSGANTALAVHTSSNGLGCVNDTGMSNHYYNLYAESSAAFNIGTGSSYGVLDAPFFGGPTITGDANARSSWRIWTQDGIWRQLNIHDLAGPTSNTTWQINNGVYGANVLRFGTLSTHIMTMFTNAIQAHALVRPSATATYDLGTTALEWRDIFANRLLRLTEQGTAPAAPAANTAVIYAGDVAGTTHLYTRTTTGITQLDTPPTVFNVLNYGALGNNTGDDGPAIQAAIDAATVNGGTVYFPPPPGVGANNIYRITTPLVLKNYVQFLGDGHVIGPPKVKLEMAGTGDLFTATATVYSVSFTGLGLRSRVGGGHIFNMTSRAAAGWTFDRCTFTQDNDAKSVYDTTVEMIEVHVDHCWSVHTATATVPTWNLRSSTNAVNVCSFRNSRFQNSGVYAIHIESTGGSYCQDLVFDNLNFQQCLGGEIRLLSVRSAMLSNVAGYDAPGPYTRSRIYIGKGASGASSQQIKLRQVVRRGGSLSGGVYDIETGGSGVAAQTTVERCNGAINLGGSGGNVILGSDGSTPAATYSGIYESTIQLVSGLTTTQAATLSGTAGAGYLEALEQSSAPAAPAADAARIYAADSAGITRLRYRTSAATEELATATSVAAAISATGMPAAVATAYRATVAKGETIPRWDTSGTVTLATGVLQLTAIALPAGLNLSTATFVSSLTAAVAPTNYWFALFNGSRVGLAITGDGLSTAWAASTAKTLPFLVGHVTTYDGLYYLGIMVKAGTPPDLRGLVGQTEMLAMAPQLSFRTTDTGMAVPPTLPFTAGSPASTQPGMPYAYVS